MADLPENFSLENCPRRNYLNITDEDVRKLLEQYFTPVAEQQPDEFTQDDLQEMFGYKREKTRKILMDMIKDKKAYPHKALSKTTGRLITVYKILPNGSKNQPNQG